MQKFNSLEWVKAYYVLFTDSGGVYPVRAFLSSPFPLCLSTSSSHEFWGHWKNAPLSYPAVANITDQHQLFPLLIHFLLRAWAPRPQDHPQPALKRHSSRPMPERYGAPPRGCLGSRSPVGPAPEVPCNIRHSYPVSCHHTLLHGDRPSWRPKGCPSSFVSFSFTVFPQKVFCSPHPVAGVCFRGTPTHTNPFWHLLNDLAPLLCSICPCLPEASFWFVFLSFCFPVASYLYVPPHSTCLSYLGLLLSIYPDISWIPKAVADT